VKRFVFGLARVLRLRSSLERERARELGRAVREAEERKQEADRAAERLARYGEQASAGNASVTTAGSLNNLRLSVEAAEGRLERANASHAEAEESVAREQERFREARREREVLERLRERRRDDWRQESSRLEQKELDEIARQRRAGGGR
jgi:flagellar FliJ protein